MGLVFAACASQRSSKSLKRYAANGQLVAEHERQNGVLDGRVTQYHLDGSIKMQGTYRAGARHGRFHYWHLDGTFAKQEYYVSGVLLWESSRQDELPPDDVLLGTRAPIEPSGHQDPEGSGGSDLAGATEARRKNSESKVEPQVSVPPTAPVRTFLSALSIPERSVQLTLGLGSDVYNTSGQRVGLRWSTARERVGTSVTVTAARLGADGSTYLAKPVVDAQVSYVLPSDLGYFVARGGGVLPLGNDTNTAALAGGASVVQAPNEAIYVLPSTIAARGALSWVGTWQYVTSQIDVGLDVAVFGYPDHVHPILHVNGVLGVGNRNYFAGAEFSSALAWTGTLSDIVLTGGAAYGTWKRYRAGIFLGKQGETTVVRSSVSYDY